MVAVNLLAMPVLSPVAMSDGQLSLRVTNSIGGPDYTMEVSTSLIDWSAILTANSPLMPVNWVDTNTVTFPMQFYRVKFGPPLP